MRWCACRMPAGGAGEVLFEGSDFVAYPRLSPDGRRLAFITWNHPNMPWDGTELRVAELTAAGLKSADHGGRRQGRVRARSSMGGRWTLYFISDRSGFWNLYARSCRTHTADMAARR